MHSIFLLFVLGLSVCFEELNAIQLSKTQPVVFLAQLKAVRRMLCMLSTYSFTFRSGSEEQYAEKEQLLQEIVDIQQIWRRSQRERQGPQPTRKSVMWPKSSVHKH